MVCVVSGVWRCGCGALAVGCDSGWGGGCEVSGAQSAVCSRSVGGWCPPVLCIMSFARVRVRVCVCVCVLPLYVVPDCATTMMALLAVDGRAGLARTAGVGSKWAVLVVCLVCMVAVCAAALRR